MHIIIYGWPLKSLSAFSPARTVEAIRKATGIQWHFHLLRHYFVSTLLAQGVDIVTIAAITGHSRITTSLIYGHTDEKRCREAVSCLSVFEPEEMPKTPPARS